MDTYLQYSEELTDLNYGNVHLTGDYVSGRRESGLEKGHIANELSALNLLKGTVHYSRHDARNKDRKIHRHSLSLEWITSKVEVWTQSLQTLAPYRSIPFYLVCTQQPGCHAESFYWTGFWRMAKTSLGKQRTKLETCAVPEKGTWLGAKNYFSHSKRRAKANLTWKSAVIWWNFLCLFIGILFYLLVSNRKTLLL